MTTLELQEELTNLYTDNHTRISEDTSAFVNHYREQALEDFKRLGIPSKKNEAYRYTDLMNYLKGDYAYEIDPSQVSVNLDELFRCDIPELDTHIVLILNGFYYKQNNPGILPDGVIICSFAEASIKYPEIVDKHYGRYAEASLDSLAALNTLFAQDGFFIYIPEDVVLDKPIQIINIGYSFKNLRLTRRNLIVAEKGSSASILVCDHTLCLQSFITNSLTEVYAGENASIDYVKLQNENSNSSQISNTFVYQEAKSTFSSNTVSLHGGLIRNNLFVKLHGEGAVNNAFGIFFCDDKQHIATYTHIHHVKPNCQSNQLFKGIIDGDGTGAFNGKILVDKYAVKTQAYQRSNNILLSKNARMNSKPHLEIYNDDVKCTHGATIGQLDTDALFYLRSRGIGYTEARQLLMYAFANEVIGKINLVPLRERMIELFEKRLKGELTHCENCNIHRIA
jgi:Fe-S cluster assembly protein SufD